MDNIEGYACFAERLDFALAPFSAKGGVLILESDPEPGYFSKNGFPENLAHASDHHLYILTKHPVTCFQDWVIQHSFKVRDELKIDLHISPGQISFLNKQHNCIRIRTQEIENIGPFLKDLKDLDIEFIKHSKHVRPYNSVVHFKKHVKLSLLGEGVFSDVNDENCHFIKVPKSLEFEEFEKIVEKIKNNCGFNMFNVAYAVLPRRDEVMNFIAIYSTHCDETRLPEFIYYLEKHI